MNPLVAKPAEIDTTAEALPTALAEVFHFFMRKDSRKLGRCV